MKVYLVITEPSEHNYKVFVQTEQGGTDGVGEAFEYDTTHPQRTILSILKELGIAGKRGRVRGRKYPKLREKNLEEAKKLLDEQGIKY